MNPEAKRPQLCHIGGWLPDSSWASRLNPQSTITVWRDAKHFICDVVDHRLSVFTAIVGTVRRRAVTSNDEEAVFSEDIGGD
jgi:hypothetical protein